MRTLDLTLPSAAENLALDEGLLLDAEHGTGTEVLRFWMSPTPFVVVGIGARAAHEVRADECASRGIPLLRRCSGGGTVVQGPGCLNYCLILRIQAHGPLNSIQGTNRHIMQRHALGLSRLIRREVTVQGHTDLAIQGRKISGNAQRRLRRHLLFHGTFLLDFDLDLVTALLPEPALQPAYRRKRSHRDFIQNLQRSATEVKRSLIETWHAIGNHAEIPQDRVAGLVQERYGRPEWNLRR
jgi:lipoate-protein ligase A